MNLKEHIQQHKNEFDSEKMSAASEVLFKKKLQAELHQPKKPKVVYLRFIAVAASIVLVLSIFFWNQNSNELTKTSEVLAFLNNESAGKRLEGVYKFEDEFKKEDSKIINTLIKILHNDANANVKIATIDALLKFPSNDNVRTNLITALEKEKTPLVQIKIIKSLSFLREHRAQKTLEEIINNEEIFPIVKSNATLAINQLKQ
ncbi:HEAT repeat domain-containing protein [Polaribacter uvawellassae]|uniref:HEAT repeat domain-containing protein n=1 Tax=Polaribacter uvawellassae TaxID=3133495 RepID=UPI00321A6DB5